MSPFPPDQCAPPSTQREAPDTDPEDDRPTDRDPAPAPSFVPFGELTESELRAIVRGTLTPMPISRRSQPPSSLRAPPTFVVYERIVDTRALRRGAVREGSAVVELLAFVVFVALFTGITATLAIALAPDPTPSRGGLDGAITSQRNAGSFEVSPPGVPPKRP